MEFLIEYGYTGLFISAFLAATLLPLGSELILTALLINESNLLLLLVVATFGNVLGSLVNYIVGTKGGNWIMGNLFRLSDSQIKSAKTRFTKYGNWILLFSWTPVIGDPLTVVAGILKTNLWLFILLVTIGKFLRYLIVALTFVGISS
ncbi:MAG: DedA family protein [Desulfamplus sp.]|nr:DedA family protein [Desulfamplus sp.]